MQTFRTFLDAFLKHIGDVIGAIMLTVIVGVLFVEQHSERLVDFSVELYIILGSMVLVQFIAPLIAHSRRFQRLYILAYAHAAWIMLVALSDANDSFMVLISLGLITSTSLWLPYPYTAFSALAMSALYMMSGESDQTTQIFTVSAYAVVAAFLIERSIAADLEKKRNLNMLAEATVERQRLQSLINSMTDGVIATNQRGTVVLYNGAALDLLNVNASLELQPLNQFMHLVDEHDKPVDIFKKAERAKAYFVSRDFKIKHTDDEYTSLFISIAPVRIGYGVEGEQGYIILLRDITKEKSLEEERDEFISVVSHELRTPITVAEGNISNAKLLIGKSKAKISTEVTRAMDDAHQQVVFLADMINDLATLSRAERDQLKVEPESIDSVELAESLARDYKLDAEQKGLKIITDIDSQAATIISSRLYVREILQNFITNAIKYTAEGSVTIRLKSSKADRIVFEVEDTGIGISKSDQKKLFQKFFRSEDYRTRQNNGTGLGLYVTLKLAKLIGAHIEVESELNKGSIFRITIPSLDDRHK